MVLFWTTYVNFHYFCVIVASESLADLRKYYSFFNKDYLHFQIIINKSMNIYKLTQIKPLTVVGAHSTQLHSVAVAMVIKYAAFISLAEERVDLSVKPS